MRSLLPIFLFSFFFFNDTATTEIYTLSLHDALPILTGWEEIRGRDDTRTRRPSTSRSEEHTSELQSRQYLVCRLLLEKKKKHKRVSVSCSQRESLAHRQPDRRDRLGSPGRERNCKSNRTAPQTLSISYVPHTPH